MKHTYSHSTDFLDHDRLIAGFAGELCSESCSEADQRRIEEQLADSQAFWDAIALIRMDKAEGLNQLKEVINQKVEDLSEEKAIQRHSVVYQ